MTTIKIKLRVKKFILSLPPKHKRQVKDYILQLGESPLLTDTKQRKNYSLYRRGDCGEYSIIYRFDKVSDVVTIVLVGRRNGNDVYKRLKCIL